MPKKRTPWQAVIALLVCLVLFGVGISAVIIRREGLEGLWRRKKSAIETVEPGAGPLLDRVDEHLP